MKGNRLQNVVCLIFCWTASASWGQAPRPVGSTIRVNLQTAGNQYQPSVCKDAAGNFVIAWVSDSSSDQPTSVMAKRFFEDGTERGPEFLILQKSPPARVQVQVACATDGSFTVAWVEGALHDFKDVLAFQRFDSAGTPQGNKVQVTSKLDSAPVVYSMGSDSAGNLVMAWVEFERAQVQFFHRDGSPRTSKIALSTDHVQRSPEVEVHPEGQAVVLWQEEQYRQGIVSLFGRRFDAAGRALGGLFLVRQQSDGYQFPSKAAFTERGRFVVAWSETYDPSGCDGPLHVGAFVQRFSAEAVGQGDPFEVTTANYEPVDMSSASPQNFLVVWENDRENTDITGQLFDAEGTAVGGKLQVPSANWPRGPVVSRLIDGEAVVVWSSYSQETGSDVFARRVSTLMAPTPAPDEDDEGGCGTVAPLPPSGGLGAGLLILAVGLSLASSRRRRVHPV